MDLVQVQIDLVELFREFRVLGDVDVDASIVYVKVGTM